VHPIAAQFDLVSDAYDRGRPEYTSETIHLLKDGLELHPGRTVLDLAAGTGKLTRALQGTGAEIIAVEPSPGMRATFARLTPGVRVLNGTAEAIPLGSATVDAVVVGQAFHWFRAKEALSEIARVLRADGGLGLVWNRRDESVPWVAKLSRILDQHDPGVPRTREEAWRSTVESDLRFGPLEHRRLAFVQPVTASVMQDRVESVSFIAALSPEVRTRALGEVESLLRSEPATANRDPFDLPYVTDVYWTLRRPPPR
jgi:ubiquinone/menaquinone biosynthesis C-methylase UbiE